MRNIQKLLMLLALVFICFSCENSDIDGTDIGKHEMSITLPVDSLSYVSFAKEGEEQTILLSANNKWTAIISKSEDESWLKISHEKGGAGENQAIVITADPNLVYKQRSSEIILACGNSPIMVIIKQESLTDIVIPEGEKEFRPTKGDNLSKEIKIRSNVKTDVEVLTDATTTEDQWLFCALTPITAKTSKSIPEELDSISFTITALANYGVQRTGKVIFKNTETQLGDTITVIQENIGTGSIVVTSPLPTTDITGELQDYKVTVKAANIEGLKVGISNATDNWITYNATANPPEEAEGEEAYIFTFKVKENATAERTATITFTDTNNSSMFKAISVKQALKLEQLDISLKSSDPGIDDWDTNIAINSTPYNGKGYIFSVTTNTEGWTVKEETSSGTVIINNSSGASGTHDVIISIPVNNSSTARDIEVTFATSTTGATKNEKTITFKQTDPNDVVVNYTTGTLQKSIEAIIGTQAGATKTTIKRLTITGTLAIDNNSHKTANYAYIQGMSSLTYFDISNAKRPAANEIIGKTVFKSNTTIDTVILYKEVDKDDKNAPNRYIPEGSFNGCTALEFVSLPKGIKNIGGRSSGNTTTTGAFLGCIKLETIDLNIDGLLTLGNDAFLNCSSLKEITLPSSITNLGQKTFRNCSSLQSIIIHATTPPTINHTESNSTLGNTGTNKPWFYVKDATIVNIYKTTVDAKPKLFGFNNARYVDRIYPLSDYDTHNSE